MKEMLPPDGTRRPQIRDKSVDLPHPLGPTIATNSPLDKVKLILDRALVSHLPFPFKISVDSVPIIIYPFLLSIRVTNLIFSHILSYKLLSGEYHVLHP